MRKLMTSNLSSIVLAVVALIVSGCSNNNATGSSNPNPLPDTYYGKNIQRIFNNCGSS